MGSYAELYLAGYPVYTTKSAVRPLVMTVFREDDKHVYERKLSERNPLVWGELEGDDELETAYEYSAAVEHVKQRLDVMGFSLEAAERAFERGIREEFDWLSPVEDVFASEKEELRQLRCDEASLLRDLTFQQWLEACAYIRDRAMPTRALTIYDQPSEEPFLVRYVLDKLRDGDDGLFPFGDVRLFIRAFVEVCPSDARV